MAKEYYHLIRDKEERYFKVDWQNGRCIMIVLCAGEKKKGRPHCLGIHHLSISSFRGTYHWYLGRKGSFTKFLYTTENQFNIAFDNQIKILREV